MSDGDLDVSDTQVDEAHWTAVECKDGRVYYDADIAANAKVQEIMIRAQVNKTELGYWRDVATDLAALVDALEWDAAHWKRQYHAMFDKYEAKDEIPF